MKTKYAFFIILIGFAVDMVGVLFRITHWSYASQLLAVASVIKIIGSILFLYKLFTYPKFKEFWNW
jgi:hypothetical protein